MTAKQAITTIINSILSNKAITASGRLVRTYKKVLIAIAILVAISLIALLTRYLSRQSLAIFETAGPIAHQQRDLMYTAMLMSLIVIVPVFILFGFILWRYRAGNKKAAYSPELDRNRWLEAIWWGIPTILIVILSVITWKSSHSLDPYRPLESSAKPVTVQVVALQWKWLFIYPELGIASVNYVQFPKDTPVNFRITSDAPMNSFWIPQLGGQVYAMSGMSTKLHLQADEIGKYQGTSANISGEGFAGMRFVAEATNQQDFAQWAKTTKASSPPLTATTYTTLARPTKDNPVTYYSLSDNQLYDMIISKYMSHGTAPKTEVE